MSLVAHKRPDVSARNRKRVGILNPSFGKPQSTEWVKKRVEARKRNGTTGHSIETREKLRRANLGKKMSPASIEKIRVANVGHHRHGWKIVDTSKMKKPRPHLRKEPHTFWCKHCGSSFRRRQSKKRMSTTLYCSRQCYGKANHGENNRAWKGGVTSTNEKVRKSDPYLLWRESVLKRDDYTCQGCGVRGGYLEVDHELPFSLYPDLRLEVLNGRVFCKKCHRKYGWTTGKLKSLYP